MDFLVPCVLLARRMATAVSVPALAASLLAGCLGTNPEQREPAVQGDFPDGNPEHRPGQPCINCHNDELVIPIAPPFALGGTVYDRIDASANDGIGGVDVIITDDEGHEFVARTNRAGNFYVEVNGGLEAPSRRGSGRVDIPWPLAFPLRASVRRNGVETPMESLIWRARSCATCHGERESAESVGRVFVDEEAMP